MENTQQLPAAQAAQRGASPPQGEEARAAQIRESPPQGAAVPGASSRLEGGTVQVAQIRESPPQGEAVPGASSRLEGGMVQDSSSRLEGEEVQATSSRLEGGTVPGASSRPQGEEVQATSSRLEGEEVQATSSRLEGGTVPGASSRPQGEEVQDSSSRPEGEQDASSRWEGEAPGDRTGKPQQVQAQLTALQQRLAQQFGIAPGEDGSYDHDAILQALDGQQQTRIRAERLYADWLGQAQRLRQSYPGFDLRQEVQNPEFLRLLQGGADMETAFRAAHVQELLVDGMHFAARESARQVAAQVAANGMRPRENGGSASVVYRSDVSLLTNAELEEITRRVRNGEHISFG